MKKIGLVLMATATLALSGCAELKQAYKEIAAGDPVRPALKGDTGLTLESMWEACEEQGLWGKVNNCKSVYRPEFCRYRVREGLNPCVNPNKVFPGEF